MKKLFRTIFTGVAWMFAAIGAIMMWPFFATSWFATWLYDDNDEAETLGIFIGLLLTLAWCILLFSWIV